MYIWYFYNCCLVGLTLRQSKWQPTQDGTSLFILVLFRLNGRSSCRLLKRHPNCIPLQKWYVHSLMFYLICIFMVLNLDMMFFDINVLRLLPESLPKAADDLKTSGLPIRTTEWRENWTTHPSCFSKIAIRSRTLLKAWSSKNLINTTSPFTPNVVNQKYLMCEVCIYIFHWS